MMKLNFLKNFLIKIFYILKMSKNVSNIFKYYQEDKEGLQKKDCERYESVSKDD